MKDHKEFEWYNHVLHIEPDDVIKCLHCQHASFDSQTWNLFMVGVDSPPLVWGDPFQYGVQEKAALHHVVPYYNDRDAREMCDANILGFYWINQKKICLI
jgi:hypothetical protein